MKAQITLIGFMVLSLISCNELKDLQGSYDVVAVDGQDMTGQGITINIEMNEDENRISGNNSCNEYGGSFTLSDDASIELGPIMATKIYCMENAKTEQAYMNQLALVKSTELKNGMLHLMNAEGNVLIKAKKNNE